MCTQRRRYYITYAYSTRYVSVHIKFCFAFFPRDDIDSLIYGFFLLFLNILYFYFFIDFCYVFIVGYTMADIHYKWENGLNSVGVSYEVSLPQFKVLGYRLRAFEIALTSGKHSNKK